MTTSILIVEDDSSAAEYLRVLLQELSFEVRTTANGVEALIALEANRYDLVISDIRMPKMDGLELLAHLEQRWPALPVIVLTANSEVSDVVEAVQLGAVNYLVKPTPAAAVIAGSDVHVLVTGDTGTGKELVARAIHAHSSFASGPFVAHNCALAPRDLFESEFFGHRRGSFTGADRDHAGLLSQADGGTLFLDELETLLPAHQAKLLRVIDDGEVRPVGAETSQRVSTRFLAATNRDARSMVAEGTLREDLYYRLRGIEIQLPPLRQRGDDILLLAAHFAGEQSAGFTADAMQALARAPWPGNVRQLRNIVQGARAVAGEGRIGLHHLSLESMDLPVATREAGMDGAAERLPGGRSLREIERLAIQQVLEECGGNRTRAAKILDIDRSTLRRKLREFGLDS